MKVTSQADYLDKYRSRKFHQAVKLGLKRATEYQIQGYFVPYIGLRQSIFSDLAGLTRIFPGWTRCSEPSKRFAKGRTARRAPANERAGA